MQLSENDNLLLISNHIKDLTNISYVLSVIITYDIVGCVEGSLTSYIASDNSQLVCCIM